MWKSKYELEFEGNRDNNKAKRMQTLIYFHFIFTFLYRKDENYLRTQSPVFKAQRVKLEEVALIAEEIKYRLISKKINNNHVEKVNQ